MHSWEASLFSPGSRMVLLNSCRRALSPGLFFEVRDIFVLRIIGPKGEAYPLICTWARLFQKRLPRSRGIGFSTTAFRSGNYMTQFVAACATTCSINPHGQQNSFSPKNVCSDLVQLVPHLCRRQNIHTLLCICFFSGTGIDF